MLSASAAVATTATAAETESTARAASESEARPRAWSLSPTAQLVQVFHEERTLGTRRDFDETLVDLGVEGRLNLAQALGASGSPASWLSRISLGTQASVSVAPIIRSLDTTVGFVHARAYGACELGALGGWDWETRAGMHYSTTYNSGALTSGYVSVWTPEAVLAAGRSFATGDHLTLAFTAGKPVHDAADYSLGLAMNYQFAPAGRGWEFRLDLSGMNLRIQDLQTGAESLRETRISSIAGSLGAGYRF